MKQISLEDKIGELIDANLDNHQFGVEQLAAGLGLSRSHLHRKLRKRSGKNASQYIREYRLEKARILLVEEGVNVSEAAYSVGFGSSSYFSKTFTAYFGYAPSTLSTQDEQDPGITPALHKILVSRKKWRGILLPLGVILVSVVLALRFVWTNLPAGNEGPHASEMSIALLPFMNLSNLPDNQYFCDGIGDAVARKLSSIKELKVISRISTSAFVQNQTPLVEMASELQSAYLLEGSIQRRDDLLRVEVGLVNGKSGIRMWSTYFDREIDDIFRIENEIAEHVANSLSEELSLSLAARTNSGYTMDAEAYDLFLRGKYELRTYTRAGSIQSMELFKQAIALDPDFAMAHNWLGHSYMAQTAMFSGVLEALDGLERAIVHIDRSIELAPDLKETRPIRAFYYLYHDWDFERADQEYRASLNNIEPEGYALYADYLNFVRRHDEALKWSEKLEDTEPYYPNTRMILSLFYTGQIEEAISYAEDRLRMMKNYYVMDSYGFVLLNSGRYEAAIRVFNEIFNIEDVRYPRILGWLGAAYARSGQAQEAQHIIEELAVLQEVSAGGSPSFFIAVVHSALGNTDEALAFLRKSIDNHEMEIPWLISEPQFFDLHDHPVFEKMVQEVGFPV